MSDKPDIQIHKPEENQPTYQIENGKPVLIVEMDLSTMNLNLVCKPSNPMHTALIMMFLNFVVPKGIFNPKNDSGIVVPNGPFGMPGGKH